MTTPTNNQTSAKSPLFATTQAPAVPTAPTVPTAPSVPAAPTFQQDVYTPTAPTTVAPQTTGLGGVINGLFTAVGKLFSGIFNFFKRLFGAPAGSAPGAVVGTPTTPGATTTPPTVPTVPTPPTTPPVTTTPPVVTTPPTTNTPPVTTVPTVPVTTEPPVLAPPPPPPPPLPPAPPPPPPVAPPPPPPIAPEAPPTPPVVAVPPTAPETPTTPTVPTTPTAPTGGELNAEEAAIAQQQGIQADRANFDAFIAEAKKLETQNAIGPGTTETAAVQELQALLAGWGYTVTANGQFDQQTVDAVLKFKRDNNLTSPYKMADGSPGVHPFIDEAAKAAMIAKLQGTAPAAPATPATPATPTPTPAAATDPAPPTPATPATPAVPTTPTTPTGTLTAEESAIAQQQGILATKPNFDAFIAEAKALETQNAIGPGTTETAAVQELQTLLAGWGYTVTPSGQFDQATIDAVLKFKRDNNLTSGYQMADGTPGVHPFIDEKAKAAMIAKLQGTAPAAPATTPAPAATPTPAPATVTTPQFQAPTNTAPLSAEETAIAQQQGIEASRANFDAFMGEAKALETQNALGPGTTQTAMVTELQQVLAQFGYAVTQNGQFDQQTVDAVLKFKRDNGIQAPYKMADGTAGVHPFIDERTKAVMIQKLGG